MSILAEHIAEYYVKNNIISKDDKDMYVFGISLIIDDIIIYSSILILSAFLGDVVYGISFATAFYFIRVRCGGFHAKRAWVCKLTMLCTFGTIMSLFYLLVHFDTGWIALAMMLPAFIMILGLCPVENPNKPLTEQMRSKNKISGLIITLIFILLAVVLYIFDINVGIIIALTVTAVAVLALIGKIINERRDTDENNYQE